jgi:hypothetical protein
MITDLELTAIERRAQLSRCESAADVRAVVAELRAMRDLSPWRPADEEPPPRVPCLLALDVGDNPGAGMDEAWRLAWYDPDRGAWQLIDAEQWAMGDLMPVGSPWLLGWRPLDSPTKPHPVPHLCGELTAVAREIRRHSSPGQPWRLEAVRQLNEVKRGIESLRANQADAMQRAARADKAVKRLRGDPVELLELAESPKDMEYAALAEEARRNVLEGRKP